MMKSRHARPLLEKKNIVQRDRTKAQVTLFTRLTTCIQKVVNIRVCMVEIQQKRLTVLPWRIKYVLNPENILETYCLRFWSPPYHRGHLYVRSDTWNPNARVHKRQDGCYTNLPRRVQNKCSMEEAPYDEENLWEHPPGHCAPHPTPNSDLLVAAIEQKKAG